MSSHVIILSDEQEQFMQNHIKSIKRDFLEDWTVDRYLRAIIDIGFNEIKQNQQ